MNITLNQLKESKDYLGYMNYIAQDNGGELLSSTWLGWKAKYEFNFIKGDNKTHFKRCLTHMLNSEYKWPKSLETIAAKNENKEDKYKKLQQKAIAMGGSLVSKSWLGCSVKHDFEMNGVVFKLTPKEVTRGQWIQDRGLVTEPICRQIFEHLFGYSFHKTKSVLTSDKTGALKALELDGYCAELNIAFEYQGHPSHWDHNHFSFTHTSKIDQLKKDTCKTLGITLIVIDKIKEKKFASDLFFNIVFNCIKSTYQSLNLTMPKINKSTFMIDFSKINHVQEQLKNLSDIAQQNGCTLLTTEWSGASSLYDFMEVKTGRILQLTSLSINKKTKGFPKNIDLHFKLKNAKNKNISLPIN